MIFKSFSEELHTLLHNKVHWVVLFIFPILTTLLLGFELDEEVIGNVPMAVINYDHSDFSYQLIEAFDQSDIFTVVQYPSSEKELETLMQNSDVRMGLIIPENFYDRIMTLDSPSVLTVYDGSHMSMTGTAKSKATEILMTYQAGATIKQLRARLGLTYEKAYAVTQSFSINNRILYNPGKSFEDFLAPILIAGSIQGALVLITSICIRPEIYDLPRKKRKGYAIGKSLYFTLMGTLIYLIAALIQVYYFHITFKGHIVDIMILSLGLSFSASAFAILVSTLIKNRNVALAGCAVLFIPDSILAGTTWPLISMPVGYQSFSKYIPFTHFVNNLRNIYLKGYQFADFQSDMVYMILFGIICLIISEAVLLISASTKGKECLM